MAKLNLFCTRCGEQANPVPSLRARKQTLAQFKALFYPNGVCRDCVLKERSAQDAELLLAKLREHGYAVRAYSPEELEGAEAVKVEAAMGKAAREQIRLAFFRAYPDGRAGGIIALVLQCLGKEIGSFDGGFVTPKEWRARGEVYGEGAELIITHDGGAAAQEFELGSRTFRRIQYALDKEGLFMDSLTCWSTGIFRI